MRDCNVCPHCCQRNQINDIRCSYCHQDIVLSAPGAITIWRLGPVRDGLIGILAKAITDALKVSCVIQPALLDERPSRRPHWKGISANVFLRQTLNRCRKREIAALGITEKNIVPSASYNFLFGLAYLGLPAATASIYPLAEDQPSELILAERIAKIALHELGHSFGLDHHSYEDAIDCLMVGDETVDCTEGVDSGNLRFCEVCTAGIQKKLRNKQALAT